MVFKGFEVVNLLRVLHGVSDKWVMWGVLNALQNAALIAVEIEP